MGVNDLPGRASGYLDHLPAVFREGEDGSQPPFLGRFLLAFEHVLTGVGDPERPGLDELLDRVPGYFDPERTPAAFLDWLAGWVALTLRADLEAGALDTAAARSALKAADPAAVKAADPATVAAVKSADTAANGAATDAEADGDGDGDDADADDADAGRLRRVDRERARTLVAGAIPLYRLRGTRRGLEELIRLLTGGLSPTIYEMTASFQLGVSSTVGVNTLLDGGAPHFFHVLLRLPQPGVQARRRVEELVRAILDVEKPAHTTYRLDVLTPAMQIGVYSRIGADTLLVPTGNGGDA